MITTILFDLGGTLWDDYLSVQATWEDIKQELSEVGIRLSDSKFKELVNFGIQSYSPSLTRAIVWQAVKGNYKLYQRILRRVISKLKARMREDFFKYNKLYAGVIGLLEELKGKYLLAVASNNFADAREWLDKFGLTGFFSDVTLSEEIWLFKPDLRFYEYILNKLSAKPEESMMVGDRLDNDIFPANRLGMTTVRVISDPFRVQKPRYHVDQPDFTIKNVTMLPQVLKLINAGLSAKAEPVD